MSCTLRSRETQRALRVPTASSAPHACVRRDSGRHSTFANVPVPNERPHPHVVSRSLQCWLVQRCPGQLLLGLPVVQHQRQRRGDLRLQRWLLDHRLWRQPLLHRCVVVTVEPPPARASELTITRACVVSTTACPVNQYSVDGSTCVACPAGSGTSGTGSTTCACLGGRASSGTGSTLVCTGPSGIERRDRTTLGRTSALGYSCVLSG